MMHNSISGNTRVRLRARGKLVKFNRPQWLPEPLPRELMQIVSKSEQNHHDCKKQQTQNVIVLNQIQKIHSSYYYNNFFALPKWFKCSTEEKKQFHSGILVSVKKTRFSVNCTFHTAKIIPEKLSTSFV